MAFVAALQEKGRAVEGHRPWPRVVVDEEVWRQAILGIAAGEATLFGLWSDGEAVHLALAAQATTNLLVVSLQCAERRFPSVACTHWPALRLERTIRDLHGLEPDGCPDERPWLDHGRWGLRHPLGQRQAACDAGDAYAFHTAEGPPLHQIPVGPVHAGIIGPDLPHTARWDACDWRTPLGMCTRASTPRSARRSRTRRGWQAGFPATAQSLARLRARGGAGQRAPDACGAAARAAGRARTA
jgi:Ni,Fe-hydrogenase III component G